ncbi:MAG: hypothetical protein NVV74_03860 [Magnetospirillum sp.]|nr:hypothetical protein [Magnetospirillum sp.]
MAHLSRRAVLAALLALAPLGAHAAEGGEPTEFYVKMPGIVVEFWDADGLFHAVNMDLSAVFPAQTSLNKKVSDKIAQTLSAMPWEEFSRGNPAATIKAVALDVLRKDPSGEKAKEVLVLKLLLR